MFDIFKRALGGFKEKSQEGERLFREAISCATANQHDKAIELFTRSIETMDIYPSAYINRGTSFAAQERYLDAWDDYTTALKMEEEDPSPHATANLSILRQYMEAIGLIMGLYTEHGDETQRLLREDGMDHFTTRWSEVLAEHLGNNPKVILNFVLAELNELHERGGRYRDFVANSGFSSSEYLAVQDLPETRNGLLLMKNLLCCFSRDMEVMFEIRTQLLRKLSVISLT